MHITLARREQKTNDFTKKAPRKGGKKQSKFCKERTKVRGDKEELEKLTKEGKEMEINSFIGEKCKAGLN